MPCISFSLLYSAKKEIYTEFHSNKSKSAWQSFHVSAGSLLSDHFKVTTTIVVPCRDSKTYDYLHIDRVLAFFHIVTQLSLCLWRAIFCLK